VVAAFITQFVAVLLLTLPTAALLRRAPEDYAPHPDGKTAKQVAAGHAASAQADFDSAMSRAQAMRTAGFYLLVLTFGLFQISITVMLL
jgi:hypothetical protein